MKKLSFLIFSILAFEIAHAQIEMNSSGHVSIGYLSPSSTYYLYTPSLSSGTFYTGSNVTFAGYANQLIFDFYGYGERRLRPNNNNTGMIGTSSYAFNKMYSYSYVTISDKRQKENIRELKGSLAVVKSLSGVQYDFKKEFYIPDNRGQGKNAEVLAMLEEQRKNVVGFIAQDVMEVFPEAVIYDDTSDVYALDYSKIIPLLVEAIKEQQSQIDELSSLLDAKSNPSPKSDNNSTLEGARLMQNNPNPFTESSEISYSIPDGFSEAYIIVYNLNGQQLKKIRIEPSKNGKIMIPGNEYKAGLYHYALVVNGELVDTKKMVLTE